MELGIDISTYLEEKQAGATYFQAGKKIDPLLAFHNNGVTLVRLRLWVNPYDETGRPYLGGTCDLQNFLQIAKLVEKYGYEIMLDIHYSDFWADPGKQFTPKAWQTLSFTELKRRVYEYTSKTIREILANGIKLKYIQVGNEITNGMLWPQGKLIDCGQGQKRDNYPQLIDLVKSGIKAIRELIDKVEIILHLERSYDNAVYREFFDEMTANQVEFDIIGVSYYPYWHHGFDDLFHNLDDMQARYQKPVMIVEVGYAFTLENYIKDGNGQLVIDENFLKNGPTLEYPLNEDGQAEFVEELLRLADIHKLKGVIYWEPLWTPNAGICWSSKEGQKYIREEGKPTRNEWANQCLFDYGGNATKAFEMFKNKKKKGGNL